VEFWLDSQNNGYPTNADLVIRDALKRTRVRISEGKLKTETWYRKLDQEAREKYRQSGRHLMQGLGTFLSSDEHEGNAEARSLGYEYAIRGRRYQLSVSEATRAFLFFRNALLDALFSVYEAPTNRSLQTLGSTFKRINAFVDEILITIMETYQAFDRSKNGKGGV
jgi:hypothetical protein